MFLDLESLNMGGAHWLEDSAQSHKFALGTLWATTD